MQLCLLLGSVCRQAVSSPLGNDDLCGGKSAHLICSMCSPQCAVCIMCYVKARAERSFDYATNMPRILSAVLTLDLVGRHSVGNIWDVEWPTDMIMAANMVNGRQPMLPANRDRRPRQYVEEKLGSESVEAEGQERWSSSWEKLGPGSKVE